MRGALPRELSLVLVHLGDRLCAAAELEPPPASSRALVWSDVDERWELTLTLTPTLTPTLTQTLTP